MATQQIGPLTLASWLNEQVVAVRLQLNSMHHLGPGYPVILFPTVGLGVCVWTHHQMCSVQLSAVSAFFSLFQVLNLFLYSNQWNTVYSTVFLSTAPPTHPLKLQIDWWVDGVMLLVEIGHHKLMSAYVTLSFTGRIHGQIWYKDTKKLNCCGFFGIIC